MRKLRETLMSQTPPIASGVGQVWVGNGEIGDKEFVQTFQISIKYRTK